ncbi:hypothetical protein ERO13_A05G110150v2 [Gossypium hirsutum]|uniref:Uncharacterized protein n=4 Tax=Gossypium TaxID=3633 RepID=A0A5J5VNF1_GOSBA|nr:hypothetical protein ES319_A05G115300v1 [Gossypium barbadense]KAG4198824.1 hypothetical protein ERO13_A05G110150v2 [Gossypium hirsutum]TYH16441.1 hypothetical protein ES288_A05G117300v1 [Gossypium darwinii]TYI26509.1 hypothetical protein ES332_A05G118700v1 [Gossypium tomentosum]TYJ33639.1 hypothetical protein E1A91_A05G116800v1 [Gossypium mustelinum]
MADTYFPTSNILHIFFVYSVENSLPSGSQLFLLLKANQAQRKREREMHIEKRYVVFISSSKLNSCIPHSFSLKAF